MKPAPTFTINSLARMSGLDRRTVRERLERAKAKPVSTSAKVIQFALADALRALAAKLKGDESARERRERLRGDLLEIELREKSGALVPRTCMDEGWKGALATIKAGILRCKNLDEDQRWQLLGDIKADAEKPLREDFYRRVKDGSAWNEDDASNAKPDSAGARASAVEVRAS